MVYTTLFFDLDDTLYPPTSRLWELIRQRMSAFMIERLSIPASQVDALRQQYLEKYGTTLRGLQHHYPVDTEEYLHYVHDLPLEEFIRPEPRLRQMLLSLPQRRWIFTNADAAHAQRVLSVLDLENCFEGIIDVRAIRFINKPDPQAYRLALEIAGEPSAGPCAIMDDALRNLAPARQMGFTTILVNPNPAAGSSNGSQPDFTIPSLLDLPKVLPGLWSGK